jgi:hypothetical protein
MTDLPTDVRDRAATAARAAWLNASAPVAETWPAVVDAVAEVLAAVSAEKQKFDTACIDVERGWWTEALGNANAERDALKARVVLLTAALTELVEVAWEAIPFVGFEGYLPERTERLRYRVNAARAALSATPTESEIDSNDLRVSHYDEPGATALSGSMRGVTITHAPTGITISHHSEQSQLQNKVRCYEDLKRRLAELAPSERRGATPTESEAP